MNTYEKEILNLNRPKFKTIQIIAKQNCGKTCISIEKCKPWQDLKHGVALLDSHEQLCKYLCSYGDMHEEKMKVALNTIQSPKDIFNQDITVIDWGCGQALASICFFEYLKNNNIEKVKKSILIEPSSKALERATLHVGTYINDKKDILSINKYLDEITHANIKASTPIVVHFFSNILDIKDINLKKLSDAVASNDSSEQYIFCISPLNYGHDRIQEFFSYFMESEKITEKDVSKLPNTRRTLKLLVFKLKAGKIELLKIQYDPAVQFHAGYRLDAVANAIKEMSNSDLNRQKLDVAFELSAPYDIGERDINDVPPIYAVLNNIITRGLPTRSSPYIEEIFEVYGNKKNIDELGNIKFNIENFDKNNIYNSIEYLSPIAISRIEKTIIEALITKKIEISKPVWDVLVIEKDVPCAAIAFEDLKTTFTRLAAISQKFSKLKFPKVNLTIISNKEYIDSPLHLKKKVILDSQTKNLQITFDLIINVSIFEVDENKNEDFTEFKYKNNCYFKIRNAKIIRSSRYIYTTESIEYVPMVEKDSSGNFHDIETSKEHLKYFLQLIFRKEDFRSGQLPILDRALQNKSVIGLLPTGGGKSLTYQLAGILQPGITLIIDPLQSLMKDQYEGLIKVGIDSCTFINSSLSPSEKVTRIKAMQDSKVQFIFLSPERLCTTDFRDSLKAMYGKGVFFSYGVIDEVHCVSEWGHDFRFSYLHLGRNLYNFVLPKNKEKGITLFGLTATASFDVLADVERELSGNDAFPLDSDTIVRYENTNRLELQYKIENVNVKDAKSEWDVYKAKNDFLADYVKKIPNLLNDLLNESTISNIKERFIERENLDDSVNNNEINNIHTTNLTYDLPSNWYDSKGKFEHAGIVFCPHRKGSLGVEDSSAKRGLATALIQDLNLPKVGSFKGGDETKDQDKFVNNDLPIMVATKAFGMGIDKPNVRFTINVNMSGSLEGFVQEAGRAGRDRKMALSTILYSNFQNVDIDVQNYFYNNNFKGVDHEKKVIHELLSKASLNCLTYENDVNNNVIIKQVTGMLPTLLSNKINTRIEFIIPYNDDKNYKGYDKYDFVAKAIYRMSCLNIIYDFTQDYNKRHFHVVTIKKNEGEYYNALKQFLTRYYSEDRAIEEVEKVPQHKGDNEIQKCLGYLIEFIYDKIALKRKRAIEDMNSFCIQGLDENKDWKETNEELKDYIYYYFNSKYAKKEYRAHNGELFSLVDDTQEGKYSSSNIVCKYMRVVDIEDVAFGPGETPKDNIKHLQGAVKLIRRSLTDANPTLDLLNAFCLFYLGVKNNEILQENLRESYQNGLIDFFDKMDNYAEFWKFFDDYHKNIASFAKQFPIQKLIEIKEEIILMIHAKIIKSLTNRYTK